MESNEYLSVIGQQIARHFGLQFQENQWSSLQLYLKNIARDLRISDELFGIYQLLSKDFLPDYQYDIFTKHLTIGETYFFREPVALEFFRNEILINLLAEQQRTGKWIRIWSAGCSSGEEPYTLAMIINEMIPENENRKIDIWATDINVDAINRARAGIYAAWSFRATSDEMKARYFISRGRNFEIIPSVKKLVRFGKLNLADFKTADSEFPNGHFDVIFCRNVLMYFVPDIAKSVASSFHKALTHEGWLITSQVELNDSYFSDFSRRMYQQGIFYAKTQLATTRTESIRKTAKQPVPTPVRKKITIPVPIPKPTSEPVPVPAATATQLTPGESILNLYADARYQDCIRMCEIHLLKHSTDTNVELLLIKSYASVGKLNDARTRIEKMIEKESLSADLWYLYSTILTECEEWSLAEKALVKTLYLSPDHLAANFALASMYKKKGSPQVAEKYYTHVSKLLHDTGDDVPVGSFEGMTAGSLRQLIHLTKNQ